MTAARKLRGGSVPARLEADLLMCLPVGLLVICKPGKSSGISRQPDSVKRASSDVDDPGTDGPFEQYRTLLHCE